MRLAYDLLALDLDGTLLDSRAELPRENIEAVRRAREAGVRVIVCTGRGLAECARYLEQLGQTDPVIVAGGAITADPNSGRTLDRVVMSPGLVGEAVDVLLGSGHAALVLKDADAAGYEYLVVTGNGGRRAEPDPVSRWWFDKMGVRVRYTDSIALDQDPGDTIRVGMCADAAASAAVAGEAGRRLGDRVVLHSFKAVVSNDSSGERRVHILEAFDARAGKWPAIERLASGMGVTPARIAAIGDEINDVGMIRGAGLGVAMGNAVPAVREVADRVTGHHDRDGVAEAIGRILGGEW